MKKRLKVTSDGILVDRNGAIWGKLVSLTIDIPDSVGGTGGRGEASPLASAHSAPQGRQEEDLQRDGGSGGKPETLPGLDERRTLIDEWARIFGKKATYSPSRMRAAERALKEEPDIAVLVRALKGAQRYRETKAGSTEFTDIFGTFRGTGDLASRISFFVEQDVATSVESTIDAAIRTLPSDARPSVRERQRHLETWLRNPGDESWKQRGELAAAWFREHLRLVCEVGDNGILRWRTLTVSEVELDTSA
jgi:hypothetical protein